MKLSEKGATFIKNLEEPDGVKLTPYRCQAGVLTIGWGHTSAAGFPEVVEGMKITREDADIIFLRDIDSVERRVNEFLTDTETEVTQEQFDALVSFTFNTGALGSATAYRWLASERPKTSVAAALCLYMRAGENYHPDLGDRRYREARLFVEGQYE